MKEYHTIRDYTHTYITDCIHLIDHTANNIVWKRTLGALYNYINTSTFIDVRRIVEIEVGGRIHLELINYDYL